MINTKLTHSFVEKIIIWFLHTVKYGVFGYILYQLFMFFHMDSSMAFAIVIDLFVFASTLDFLKFVVGVEGLDEGSPDLF